MAQTLTTTILINAKVGNGFAQVGATLTELGSMVNGVSQELINFGKDSINVYREYEKSMKDAEVALSTTYGRNTKELSTVMSDLDASATEWAATTIFHTNDVANAISEAAHAGWDFDQIMSGIPAAMELAQAGGLDLSEAVNYIVKSTSAAGIGFEDLGNFIDLWAFAANSSASTIGEFGDAMLRMGSTMRFAANPEELMTLIAVTANAGQTGSEAGTLIRNSMMRLVAPTDKANKAMAQLGATSDEAAALMEDQALAAANARLAANGFSAFDEKGNLKNVLDIYRELYMALGEVAGGFENIDKNQDALGILSSIFPTRTITEALTLLRGASEGYDGLYEAMMGGDAADYGSYAAETMMDSLDGKIETFESKVERLKQAVGEELAPQLEGALSSIGGLVDKISGMDEGNFSALVSGLEIIAGAGPALLLAGGAFRLIGYALTPAGGIGLGLVALTAAAAAIKELKDTDFADNFGNMEIDTEGIQTYVESIGEDFKGAYAEVDAFRQALDESVTSYETASSTFSSKLFSDMLTNAKLTEEDKTQLTNLGNDMYLAVQEAIQNSAAASMSYWNTLFGGEGEAEVDPAYQELIDLTNQAYEEAMANAESISQDMRSALTDAFSDGEISPDEYQNILSYMRSYNDAIAKAAAEAQSEEDYIKMGKWMHQAQTASWDDIKDIAKSAEAERDSILADQEDRYLTERYRAEYRGADEATLQAADDAYHQQQMQTKSSYDEFLSTLWDSQIQQSGMGDAYEVLGNLADSYMNGTLSLDTAEKMLAGQMDASKYAGQTNWKFWENSDRESLGKMMGYMINSFGGQSGIAESIEWYKGQGNTDMADQLSRIYAMEQLVNGFGVSRISGDNWWEMLGDDFSTSNQDQYLPDQMNREAFEQTVQPVAISDYSVENARATAEAMGEGENTIKNLFNTLEKEISGENFGTELSGALMGLSYDKTFGPEFQNMYEQLSKSYDLEKVIADTKQYMPYEGAWAEEGSAMREPWGMYQLMYGEASANAEDYRITVTPEVDTSAIGDFDPVPLPIEPRVEGTDAAEQLQSQGVTVDVDADTQSLEATIDGADGQTLMEYVDGDAANLQMSISDQDGKTLVENVTGNASSLASIINSYNGRTITVNIQGNKMFASGGRATTASIFGEAGPEWAIPEEHSERTAELLNAAREASGFTWPDLLARYGGLNANTDSQPTTIIYSPTIHAADASGVEQVLLADKERLNKWFEDKKMRDEVEVYA